MALAAALLTIVFGSEIEWLLFTFGITFVLGTLLVGFSSAARIHRGDVKLRPWDAARKAPVLFLIMLAAQLLAEVVFRSRDLDLTEGIVVSAAFAIVYGLYTTAYREPA